MRDIGMGKKRMDEVIVDEVSVLCVDIVFFNGKLIDNIWDFLGMFVSNIVYYVLFGYRWYLIVGNLFILWRIILILIVKFIFKN